MALPEAYAAQRCRYVTLPNRTTLHAAGADAPSVLYHFTTLPGALSILRDGHLRNSSHHKPPGVYGCRDQLATFYDRGGLVHYRPIAFLVSAKSTKAVDWSEEVPTGVILQIKRSVHEFVVHSNSTEIFRVDLDQRMLSAWLQQQQLHSTGSASAGTGTGSGSSGSGRRKAVLETPEPAARETTEETAEPSASETAEPSAASAPETAAPSAPETAEPSEASAPSTKRRRVQQSIWFE